MRIIRGAFVALAIGLMTAGCATGRFDPPITNGSPHARDTCHKQQFPQCGGTP